MCASRRRRNSARRWKFRFRTLRNSLYCNFYSQRSKTEGKGVSRQILIRKHATSLREANVEGVPRLLEFEALQVVAMLHLEYSSERRNQRSHQLHRLSSPTE